MEEILHLGLLWKPFWSTGFLPTINWWRISSTQGKLTINEEMLIVRIIIDSLPLPSINYQFLPTINEGKLATGRWWRSPKDSTFHEARARREREPQAEAPASVENGTVCSPQWAKMRSG